MNPETATAEVVEVDVPNLRALATRHQTGISSLPDSPLPIFTGKKMIEALTAYRDLQKALDQSMPDQIMELDGKPFRKKGYWRAIAVAFGLTVEPTDEKREVSGLFQDGRDNFGYVVTCKATAPNGRAVIGDGTCFAIEKARRFKCPHPESEGSKRTLHFPHNTCPDFDPDFSWKSLPGEATEHNVRAHAHTRAYNRAVSNLVAFGEVSADEINFDDGAAPAPAPRSKPAATNGSKPPAGAGDTVRVSVLSIASKDGVGAKGPWTRWAIKASDGKNYITFKPEHYSTANDAKKSSTDVEITFTESKFGRDVMSIGFARDESEIPPLADEDLPF